MAKTVIINMYTGATPPLPPDVISVGTLRPLNPLTALARAILRRISTRTVALFEDRSVLAPLAEADTAILFDYKGMRPLMKHIDSHYPQLKRKILFFWNTLGSPAEATALPDGWEACTFDPGDAQRAAIRYVGQFFFPTPSASASGNGSICFIGRDKGRRRKLDAIARRLSHAVPVEIAIVSPLSAIMPWRYEAPMSYDTYIDRQSRATALLELCRPGQTGLTLRTLEALSHGQKLLTDNPAIERYALFTPDRIASVDNSTTEQTAQWLEAPTTSPSPDLSDYYFENWLDRVVSGRVATDFC